MANQGCNKKGVCCFCRWTDEEFVDHCGNGQADQYGRFPNANTQCSGFESRQVTIAKLTTKIQELEEQKTTKLTIFVSRLLKKVLVKK